MRRERRARIPRSCSFPEQVNSPRPYLVISGNHRSLQILLAPSVHSGGACLPATMPQHGALARLTHSVTGPAVTQKPVHMGCFCVLTKTVMHRPGETHVSHARGHQLPQALSGQAHSCKIQKAGQEGPCSRPMCV